MDDQFRDLLTIFAGRFGSGKTEVAINYALRLVHGSLSPEGWTSTGLAAPSSFTSAADGVMLVDLDIVTPYFRSRETAAILRERGVEVVAPSVIGQHLDTPAITPQILGAIQRRDRPVVLDVGGDRQGARALGQFSQAIRQRGYAMHFVVNPYRPFTSTQEGVAQSIREIEGTSRLEVTGLVSNPNLMYETTSDHIKAGHAQIEEFARELELPVALVCIERRWAEQLAAGQFAQPVLVLDRFFVMSWE
jgi:hypothetical protein